MANALRAVLLVACLAGCAEPPASKFVSADASRNDASAFDIGATTKNEACVLQPGEPIARIYCGPNTVETGRVIRAAQQADPAAYIASSPWREAFDRKYSCGEVRATTLHDLPAATMACVGKKGGWPRAVLAAQGGGALYVADAVGPAEPALARAIGVMAGSEPGIPAKVAAGGSLEAERAALAALDAKGANAEARVRKQMRSGANQNRQGNYAAAERAYRAAVALEEAGVGRDNPALAIPLARLAVQISNQEPTTESAKLLDRAARLAAASGQIDDLAVPVVTYLRGLDALNRQQPAEALALLDAAEAGFRRLVPADDLAARPVLARGGVQQMADGAADSALQQDGPRSEALHGLIETSRYRVVALGDLGRPEEAKKALASAQMLYAGREGRLAARYFRTVGMSAASGAAAPDAEDDLRLAEAAFAHDYPGSITHAKTQLLLAGKLAAAGDTTAAARLCRAAAATFRSNEAGAAPKLVMPCLDAYAAEIDRRPEAAQALRAEMLGVSQLAQSAETNKEISAATKILITGARDPAAGEAVRQSDDAEERLSSLERRRSEVSAATGADKADVDKLDEAIVAARAARREAGEAVQAAAPGVAALAQQSVTATEAQAALGRHEVLVAVVMDADVGHGWIFLLRGDRIETARLEGGARRVDALVARFRKSVLREPNGTRPPPFDIAAAQDLYAAVLGPVAKGFADADSIVVAPSGSLLSIPFGALLTGPANGDALAEAPFLVRRFAISHVPTIASFVNLRRAAKTVQAPSPWFGMGDFRPPTVRQAAATFPAETCKDDAVSFARLVQPADARDYLEKARNLFGASPSDMLLGPAFTAPNVTAAALKSYRILHFATHAVLAGELHCVTEPAVITSTPDNAANANGALLTASAIAQMKLNAELVILAACNTGGSSGAGESLSGLARSFFHANARALLVTHWYSNNASTPLIVDRVLKEMVAAPEGGPAMALAKAQRSFLKEDAVGDIAFAGHPYYWAHLALIGGAGGRSAAVAEASKRATPG